MRRARQVTQLLAAFSVMLVGAGVLSVAVAGHAGDVVYVGVAACTTAVTTALALLVARRQPANVVAPLLGWMGLLAAGLAFSDRYPLMQARRPETLPALPDVASAALASLWVWIYVALSLLLLCFPDGRPLGSGWRRVARSLPAIGVVIAVVMAVSPGPYDHPFEAVHHPFGDLPAGLVLGAKIVLFPTLCVLLLAAAASLRVRYRQGDAVRRAQLKWLTLAAVSIPITVLLSWVGFLLLGTHSLAGIGLALAFVTVPVATAVAILRHDLYDVDRVLSAAVTYGIVTAGVVGAFALASVVTGAVLGRGSVVVAATVAALTTLAAGPARRRLNRIVDRRLYPMRRAALEAIEALRAAIVVSRAEPERLEAELRIALRDPELRVALTFGGRFLDLHGERVELGSQAIPVTVEGQRIGAIASSGPAPVQLLREVADAAAVLVEMARLRQELSAALHAAASSRARLQRVGDSERRRLERDLHDGAQQRLVSLGMALRLAQRHLRDDTLDIDGLLDEAVAQLGTAVSELREVAHGLRPSALDEGLAPALSSLADAATLPIELDLDATHAIPDDVATTAYYVVSESVTNAVKHANASRIRLRVARVGEDLCVRIEDDGRGGAAVRPGSGLAGLSDRVAAAGGRLRVTSPPSEGTAVEVQLPCAS